MSLMVSKKEEVTGWNVNRLTGGLANKILTQYGRLTLTDTQLIFQSRDPLMSAMSGSQVIMELKDIVEIKKAETMLGLSKEIWVTLTQGRLERFFTLRKRDELVDAVKKKKLNT